MVSIGKVGLGLISAIVTGLFVQPYRPVIVRGHSMEPTFEDGQLVFAQRMSRKPRVGDIVLVDHDGATLVKRVTMVEGDRYEEAYVPIANRWEPIRTQAVRRMVDKGRVPSRISAVPKGQMFISGDNADNSYDSRFFGFIPESSVRGLIRLIG